MIGGNGLFDRIGLLIAALEDANAFRGGAATSRVLSGANLATRVNSAETAWAGGTAIRQVLDGIYNDLGATQSALNGTFTSFRTRVVNTLKAMYSIDQGVSADAPLSLLTAVDEATAVRALIAQMIVSGDDVNASAPTAGAQTAVGVPNGNAVVVVSVKNAAGQLLQYALPETLRATCTGDSQSGSTLGQEPVRITGQTAVADVFSHLWPGGSGASKTPATVDGSGNNAKGNSLNNSSFEIATVSNSFDNWYYVTGTAGTTILAGGSSGTFDGSNMLKFVGDGGSTLNKVAQQFAATPSAAVNAGGTAATLAPSTQYAFNCWLKGGDALAAGTAQAQLTDGTNTAVVDGTAVVGSNVTTMALTGVTTTWVPFSGTFRTPAVLPAALRFQIGLSVALANTKELYIDKLAVAPMTELYSGGPSVAVFSGNAKLILNDAWTVAVGQTYGAFQKWLDRIFNLRGLGLTIPFDSAGGETVSDSLIA